MQAPQFIEPDIVTISAGDFLMGSENGAANERPIHRVWGGRFRYIPIPRDQPRV